MTNAIKIAAVLAKIEGKDFSDHCPLRVYGGDRWGPCSEPGNHLVEHDHPDTGMVFPCKKHFPAYIEAGWREVDVILE
jgi:hypothetical protein